MVTSKWSEWLEIERIRHLRQWVDIGHAEAAVGERITTKHQAEGRILIGHDQRAAVAEVTEGAIYASHLDLIIECQVSDLGLHDDMVDLDRGDHAMGQAGGAAELADADIGQQAVGRRDREVANAGNVAGLQFDRSVGHGDRGIDLIGAGWLQWREVEQRADWRDPAIDPPRLGDAVSNLRGAGMSEDVAVADQYRSVR